MDVEKFSVVKNTFLDFLNTCYCKGLGCFIWVIGVDSALQLLMNNKHELFLRVTWSKIEQPSFK